MIEANKIEYWSGVGDEEQVLLAIRSGYDVNETSDGGYTALHAAAENNRLEVIRVLLEHGANPNAKVISGETPLAFAELTGCEEAAALLRPITT
jgi:ankyrin repeat protein